ncbi:hypothetical protein DPM19_12770 [Actinomadura craniellae]|uniref:WD40 repeat domain-containing protein n=1 Tax=Actinomadura craniellae TaxID=2231787 RepID=A0A365H6F6_9ACTN|nr:hypothetical protein [Actinomadura craniellae]RAY14629.1 hypothetical protein DPM19_12770 [Actinomadura craniellae]
MTAISRLVTHAVPGSLNVHDFSAATETVVAFPLPEGVRPRSHAAAPDLSRATYVTDDEAVCIDRGGRTLWRLDYTPDRTRSYNSWAKCAFSPDGTVVWVYRPDAMAGMYQVPDRWLAIDAGTGDVLAETGLDCAGHGAFQFAHPDGEHMLIDVGEGQDGARVYRGRLVQDTIELTAYPWADRCLMGLAPDGRHFMTVGHDQEDVAFHTYPDGEVTVRIPAESFGHDLDETRMEWSGGYLDLTTAVVTTGGETEDEEEWHTHHLVDPRTGEIKGTLDTPSRHAYDLVPLGDGIWITTDDTGRPLHHTR